MMTTSSAKSNNATHNKDNMSIGSAESLAPRWGVNGQQQQVPSSGSPTSSPGGRSSSKNIAAPPQNSIYWVGIVRDDVMLCEYCTEPNNNKVLQMSRRFLKSSSSSSSSSSAQQQAAAITPQKADWEFKTYAIQSQRRMVHAIKFTIYEMVPMIPGSRAKLQNLVSHTFLNGETVRIIEYQASTKKYLIRPSIPLPQVQQLATTGMLVVHAKHLIPLATPSITSWTFCALYDGKYIQQNMACQLLEKLMILSENFRSTDDIWKSSTQSNCCQTSFGPILQNQVDVQYSLDITTAVTNNTSLSIDESLEYTKEIIEQNRFILSLLNNNGNNPQQQQQLLDNTTKNSHHAV